MRNKKCTICGKTKEKHFKDKNDTALYCYKKSAYGLRVNTSNPIYKEKDNTKK